jgi:hypothetical protein
LRYILVRADLLSQAAEYAQPPEYDNQDEYFAHREEEMTQAEAFCNRLLLDVEREFDASSPILSPKSHSLYSKIRDQVHHLINFEFSFFEIEALKSDREFRAAMAEAARDLPQPERPIIEFGKFEIGSDEQLEAVNEFYKLKGLQAPFMLVVLWRMAVLDGIKPTCSPLEMFKETFSMYKEADADALLPTDSNWQFDICDSKYRPSKRTIETYAMLLKAYLCAAYAKAQIARFRNFDARERMLWQDFEAYKHTKSIDEYKVGQGEFHPYGKLDDLPLNDPALKVNISKEWQEEWDRKQKQKEEKRAKPFE